MMRGYDWYDMMNGYGWGGFGLFGIISSILFWAVIILIIVALIRYLGGYRRYEGNDEQVREESSVDILKKRYAKGEITKRQFDEMKKDLG